MAFRLAFGASHWIHWLFSRFWPPKGTSGRYLRGFGLPRARPVAIYEGWGLPGAKTSRKANESSGRLQKPVEKPIKPREKPIKPMDPKAPKSAEGGRRRVPRRPVEPSSTLFRPPLIHWLYWLFSRFHWLFDWLLEPLIGFIGFSRGFCMSPHMCIFGLLAGRRRGLTTAVRREATMHDGRPRCTTGRHDGSTTGARRELEGPPVVTPQLPGPPPSCQICQICQICQKLSNLTDF